MKIWVVLLLNAAVSLGISIGVLYWAPGYALTPSEIITAANNNTRAITRLAESVAEVIKRMNEIAPPEKGKEIVRHGERSNSSH